MTPISPFFTLPTELHQTLARELPIEAIRTLRTTCKGLEKSMEPLITDLTEAYSMISAFFPAEDVSKDDNSNLIYDDLRNFKKELSSSFTNPETILSEREELRNKLSK